MSDWQPILTILSPTDIYPSYTPTRAGAWGPIVAWKTCVFHRLLKFSGRASRSEYWYFALGNFLLPFIFAFIAAIIYGIILGFGDSGGKGMLPLIVLGIAYLATVAYCIVAGIAGISVGVRRMHDIGKSGWWLLPTMLPFIGFIFGIVVLVFSLMPSDGANPYGPGPDGPAA